jgi:prevent-host-death family protein
MINIRPVSDLRNKYPEIEELVLKEDEAVYLTKNGYGSMVVMSIEKYGNLMKQIDEERALDARFGHIDIEKALDKSEEELDNLNTEYLTHEEVFSKARRIINGPQ